MSKILDLFFPRKCVFCGKVLDGDNKYICDDCQKTLPWTTEASCKTTGDFFVRCVSPLRYDSVVRQAIHKYKFKRMEPYAMCFGELIAQCVTDNIAQKPDLITFVPLSLPRRLQRGYNQSRLIAEQVAIRTGVPIYPVLRRIRHTSAQSRIKEPAVRKANVSGAFRVNNTDITGLKILLIDDVVTTGSTLSECSRMLLMAGADSVYCATLAKAGHTVKVKTK